MKPGKSFSPRRQFIKGLGSGALLAAAGMGTSCSIIGTSNDWSSTFDWICVGSGSGGLGGVIAGHDKGMKTLLLEQSNLIGGTSTQASQCGAFAPMHPWQLAAGIQDTREKALAYLRLVGGGYAQEGHMAAYVDNAARVVQYLNEKDGFEFRLGGGGFYDAVDPAAGMPGRTALCSNLFPAEKLGAWRDKVNYSLWYRGFVEALEELEGFRSPLADEGPARTVESQLDAWRRRLGPEKFEALVRDNEEHRRGGAAWVAHLFYAVMNREIDVRTEAKVEKLIMENGRVVGLTVNQNGTMENIRARKGVLLALGNDWLGMEVGWGPAWMLAAEVGAQIQSEPLIIKMVTIHVPDEKFSNGKANGRTNYERFMQHSLIVNRLGERFDNEAFYAGVGRVVNHFDDWDGHRFRNFPNYFIFDRNLLDKYSFGGMPPGNAEGLDWVTQANTLSDLARRMEIDSRTLQRTVARFNEFARRGADADFNRNPSTMGPLEKPPFYGVQTSTPDPFSTLTTVVTSPQAEVLQHVTEKPIPGLYCCGAMCTTSRIWGIGYQGGYQLTGGVTFGFLAAEHAAAAST